ncbi:MAG: DUF2804 family protein [Myxococcota bacterium]|nr:DUF2804 family protein [Myxococcota bacterium]
MHGLLPRVEPPVPGRFSSTDPAALDGRFPRVGAARFGPPWLRAKRWSYAAVVSPLAFCGVTLADATYACQATVWVFDRKRHDLACRTWLTPPVLAVRVPEHPIRDDAVFRWPGAAAAIRHHGAACPREIRAEISVDGRPVELFVSVQAERARVEPVQYAGRLDPGWQFTHKAMGIPVEGFVRIGTRRLPLSGGFLLADYSHGLMPRRVAWWWAAGAGTDDRGRIVAFNLVSGFNDAEGGENTTWIDLAGGQLGRSGLAPPGPPRALAAEPLAPFIAPPRPRRRRRPCLPRPPWRRPPASA